MSPTLPADGLLQNPLGLVWVAADYSRRRHSYTRRPHLYDGSDTGSLCGRAERQGINTRILDDVSAWRCCAICEAILATHEEAEGRPVHVADLPSEPAAMLAALSGSDTVDIAVTRIVPGTPAGVRTILVTPGRSNARLLRYLLSIVSHDADTVRFLTEQRP
jgi:hypothetical protein